MVPHDGPTSKTTAVVSFHEERNKIAEIPRVDPADKPNLWISKVEIHHNTMMTKIRGLVQEKLFELVAKDENFFAGIENLPMELDDMEVWQEQKKPRPETEEEILLAKKAQVLQDLLNAIMDLPKDEILSFLTSNTLPIGLQRPSKSSSEEPHQGPQAQKRSAAGPTDPAAQKARVSASIARSMGSENYYYDNAQKQEEDQTHSDYNWILDCDDAWEDLPAVVKINAIELGYNERLWDEDAQDMPIFRTLWKTLSPNQKTAAVFLGNYTEQFWNDDVRMLVMAGKPPSLASIVDDEEDQAPSSKPSQEEANDGDGDDDDDNMFSELLSNFASEDSEEEETEEDEPVVVERFMDEEDEDDSEAMMDEFLANFGGSSDIGDESTLEKETSVDDILMEDDDDDEDDSEAMMDEFMANFGGSADSGNETTEQKESTANIVPVDEDDDEEEDAMMDEFLSNFVETSNEEDETDADKKETSESENSGKDDDDDEEAMMDESLSNFVETAEEKETPAKESPVATRSVVPEEADDEDAMMDEFMSNFIEPSNEEGETEDTTDVGGGSTPSPTQEEETEADDDAAMMDEFVAPADQENTSSDPQPVSIVPNFQSVRDDAAAATFDDEHEASDGSDEEQPLVPSSSPTGAAMDRGFSGETSPLLASSSKQTKTEEPELAPQTYWESVSSYLYWIPVVVGLPVVYSMVAGGSEA